MNRPLANLALAVVSLLLALAIVEMGVRTIGLPSDFRRLIALYGKPTRNVGDTILWNHDRPRHDIEHIEAIDDDSFVIVGLGDSIMYGVEVPAEHTYLEQTRGILNQRASGRVEIINLAVPGYNTAQENAVHEEISDRISADLVVVHYWADDWRQYRIVGDQVVDFGDMLHDGGLVQALPLPRAVNDFLLVRSHLYALLTHVVVSNRVGRKPTSFQQVEEPMVEIHERTKKIGGKLLVLVSASLETDEPTTIRELSDMKELGRKRGFEVVDVTPWVAGIPSSEIALDGCHFNEKGHRLLAENLAELLVKNYL